MKVFIYFVSAVILSTQTVLAQDLITPTVLAQEGITPVEEHKTLSQTTIQYFETYTNTNNYKALKDEEKKIFTELLSGLTPSTVFKVTPNIMEGEKSLASLFAALLATNKYNVFNPNRKIFFTNDIILALSFALIIDENGNTPQNITLNAIVNSTFTPNELDDYTLVLENMAKMLADVYVLNIHTPKGITASKKRTNFFNEVKPLVEAISNFMNVPKEKYENLNSNFRDHLDDAEKKRANQIIDISEYMKSKDFKVKPNDLLNKLDQDDIKKQAATLTQISIDFFRTQTDSADFTEMLSTSEQEFYTSFLENLDEDTVFKFTPDKSKNEKSTSSLLTAYGIAYDANLESNDNYILIKGDIETALNATTFYDYVTFTKVNNGFGYSTDDIKLDVIENRLTELLTYALSHLGKDNQVKTKSDIIKAHKATFSGFKLSEDKLNKIQKTAEESYQNAIIPKFTLWLTGYTKENLDPSEIMKIRDIKYGEATQFIAKVDGGQAVALKTGLTADEASQIATDTLQGSGAVVEILRDGKPVPTPAPAPANPADPTPVPTPTAQPDPAAPTQAPQAGQGGNQTPPALPQFKTPQQDPTFTAINQSLLDTARENYKAFPKAELYPQGIVEGGKAFVRFFAQEGKSSIGIFATFVQQLKDQYKSFTKEEGYRMGWAAAGIPLTERNDTPTVELALARALEKMGEVILKDNDGNPLKDKDGNDRTLGDIMKLPQDQYLFVADVREEPGIGLRKLYAAVVFGSSSE